MKNLKLIGISLLCLCSGCGADHAHYLPNGTVCIFESFVSLNKDGSINIKAAVPNTTGGGLIPHVDMTLRPNETEFKGK